MARESRALLVLVFALAIALSLAPDSLPYGRRPRYALLNFGGLFSFADGKAVCSVMCSSVCLYSCCRLSSSPYSSPGCYFFLWSTQDLLWEELTAYDHMLLLARFKGVPQADIPAHVSQRLDAVRHAHHHWTFGT